MLQNSFFAIDTNQSVHSQVQTVGTTPRTLAVSPDFTFSLVISWSSVELVQQEREVVLVSITLHYTASIHQQLPSLAVNLFTNL